MNSLLQKLNLIHGYVKNIKNQLSSPELSVTTLSTFQAGISALNIDLSAKSSQNYVLCSMYQTLSSEYDTLSSSYSDLSSLYQSLSGDYSQLSLDYCSLSDEYLSAQALADSILD